MAPLVVSPLVVARLVVSSPLVLVVVLSRRCCLRGPSRTPAAVCWSKFRDSVPPSWSQDPQSSAQWHVDCLFWISDTSHTQPSPGPGKCAGTAVTRRRLSAKPNVPFHLYRPGISNFLQLSTGISFTGLKHLNTLTKLKRWCLLRFFYSASRKPSVCIIHLIFISPNIEIMQLHGRTTICLHSGSVRVRYRVDDTRQKRLMGDLPQWTATALTQTNCKTNLISLRKSTAGLAKRFHMYF